MTDLQKVRANRAYRERAQALKVRTRLEQLPCWICGRPIDTELDWREPMAFTAHHVDPIGNGGHILGRLEPAHRVCNSRLGTGQKQDTLPRPKTSRRWL